jgi:hypothetical protein
MRRALVGQNVTNEKLPPKIPDPIYNTNIYIVKTKVFDTAKFVSFA